jgi:acetoacetyl-CoA synthetase
MTGSTSNGSVKTTKTLWTPSEVDLNHSEMALFKAKFADALGQEITDYASLHSLSIKHSALFWSTLWASCGVKGVLADADKNAKLDAKPPESAFFKARWFNNSTLNFAENLLGEPTDDLAIVGYDEQGHWRSYTRADMRQKVLALASTFKQHGIEPGDRIAGYLPNLPETIIAMLATAAIGAVWTSCSPDFGINSVVDRFSQVSPRIFITVDGYQYKGKTFRLNDKIDQIIQSLPSVEQIILIHYLSAERKLGDTHDKGKNAHSHSENTQKTLSISRDNLSILDWHHCIENSRTANGGAENSSNASAPPVDPEFQQFPFNHPFYILYSSGTTGKPKCIVHGAGSTLLQHLKELRLHTDVTHSDTLLYYTSCGWMMWNWMASTLATGAKLVTYDGAPMSPDPTSLLMLLKHTGVTIFGTSARFIHALNQAGVTQQHVQLPALRSLLSTGSPLAAEDFDYIYDTLAPQVRLCSISGGTDIISCFVLGSPLVPVYRGQIQCAGLGMAVEVWNEHGERISGQKGELVCTAPFPAMPLKFWNDANDARYHAAYFERFPNVWAHGDYAEQTLEGGFIIYGRSDAILNPQGVRIGTAEIYNPVQKIEAITDCLAAPLETNDGDVQIVLFITLKDPTGSAVPSTNLREQIKQAITTYASPRHVPKYIACAPDLPRTHSGKLMEVLVKTFINGETPNNLSAVANPECLAFFETWQPIDRKTTHTSGA